MGSLLSAQFSRTTLGGLGARKLRALASALQLSERLTTQALDVFALMGESWADWAVGDAPVWPNDISDDGTPFEFSASFDGTSPRLRMLVESQTEPISRMSSWEAGLALGERLRATGLADLSMFDEIRDLFVPHAAAQGRFSLWHAAVVEQGRPALFKAYVNPCLFGTRSAPYVVERALQRLGFEEAWRFVKERLSSDPNTEVRYFSVDLEQPEQARVKIYLGCSDTAWAVDRLIAGARNVQSDDAQHWLSALTASQGPFDKRPILNCFSFRRQQRVPDVTVHVPIRCYVKHDAEALARVSTLLTAADAERLSASLSAVSERPLNVGRGLLTYASLRREDEATRVTVYLAPEAYSITSRRPTVPPANGFSSGVHKASLKTLPGSSLMTDVLTFIARYEQLLCAQPLFRHLGGAGTTEQAERVSAYLSLLVLWLGDLFRFAQDRVSDPGIALGLAELSRVAAARAARFRQELQDIGLSPNNLSLYTEEHSLIREVAFARVADVVSAEEDCVRLGIVLSISATCAQVLKAGTAFAERAVLAPARRVAPVDPLDPKQRPPSESFEHFDSKLDLSQISMSELVASDVYAAIDRCFESVLRVVAMIDEVSFGA